MPFHSLSPRGKILAVSSAALLLTSAHSLWRLPAAAQGSPACEKYAKDKSRKGLEADIRCEMEEIERRTKEFNEQAKEAKRQSEEAKRQSEEAKRQGACVDAMKAGIQSGKYSIEVVRNAYGGQSVRDADACAVLKKLEKN